MRPRSCLLFMLAAIVAASDSLAQPHPAIEVEYRLFDLPEAHFRCEAPRDWRLIRDKHEESRTHCYGIYLAGPDEDAPLGPTLSARYFAPDNTLGDTAEKYLRRHQEPGLVPLQGEKTSAPEKTTLDGRPAKKFTRDTFEFFPPESLDTKKIPFREEYCVAPHLGGFVVLKLAAPTAGFARWRPVFQHLLDTFRFLPEHAIVTVRAKAIGLSAFEVETAIAAPLEAKLANLPGCLGIRSASRRGECTVWLAFDCGVELAAHRTEIQQRIAAAKDALPPGTALTVGPPAPADSRPLLIALYSIDRSRPRSELSNELEAFAATTLLNRIAVLPGVAEAVFVGGERRYEITPVEERMNERDVDVQDLFAAIKRLETPRGAAIVPRESPDDLRRVQVAMRSGTLVLLGEIAEVRFGRADRAQKRIWFSDRTDEAPAAVLIDVQTLADADADAVDRAVESVLTEVRTLLPPEIKVDCREFGNADVRLFVRASNNAANDNQAADFDRAAAEIASLPGIESVWRVDAPVDEGALDELARAELLLAIAPDAIDRRDELVDEMRSLAAKSFPATCVSVGSPTGSSAKFPSVLGQFTLTISGPDLAVLDRLKEQVLPRVQKISGIVDLQAEPEELSASLRLEAHRENANRYGLDADALVDIALSIVERRAAGRIAGPGGRPIDVTVMFDEFDPAKLGRLPVSTPDGARLPLESVLSISLEAQPGAVFREQGRRAVIIACNARKRDPAAVFNELRALARDWEPPPNYSIRCDRNAP